MAHISGLWTYPVKSCQGVAVDAVRVTELGLAGDRTFALWADGELVEQKATPGLAAIGAALSADGTTLTLSHPDAGTHTHQRRDEGAERTATWAFETFTSVDQGDEVAGWLEEALRSPTRLVLARDPWDINLPIPQFDRLHARPKQSFTAASPVGLANQASLDDLNDRLDEPIPMDRFRVNVVIDGVDPYAEDDIATITCGDVVLTNVVAAERCAIVTTDQRTGERPPNNVLATLSAYRKKPKGERFASGLAFGAYMAVDAPGELRVGDELAIEFRRNA